MIVLKEGQRVIATKHLGGGITQGTRGVVVKQAGIFANDYLVSFEGRKEELVRRDDIEPI